MFGLAASSVERREPTGYQLALQSKEATPLPAAVEGESAEGEDGEGTAVVVRGRGPRRCSESDGDGDDEATRPPKVLPFPDAFPSLAAVFGAPRPTERHLKFGEALGIGFEARKGGEREIGNPRLTKERRVRTVDRLLFLFEKCEANEKPFHFFFSPPPLQPILPCNSSSVQFAPRREGRKAPCTLHTTRTAASWHSLSPT